MDQGEEGLYVAAAMPFPVFFSKGLKSHTEQLDACHVVGRSAVPRKLRSAMRKRSHGFALPPLPDGKKLQHELNGTELPQFGYSKKSRMKMKLLKDSSRCVRQTSPNRITEDEQQVVETLYSLANMSGDKKHVTSRVDGMASEAKSSYFQKTREHYKLDSQDGEEESMNSKQGSLGETVKVDPLGECLVPQLAPKFNLGLDINAPHQDSENVPWMCQSIHGDYMRPLLSETANKTIPHEFCPRIGLRQSMEHEIGSSPITGDLTQPGLSRSPDDYILNGFWTSTDRDEFLRNISTEAPANSASGSDPTLSFANKKLHAFTMNTTQLQKRCAKHIYISHLIQAYREEEKNPSLSISSNQSTVGGTQGFRLENQTEYQNVPCIHEKKIQQEQWQSCTASQLESSDILSLLIAGSGWESTSANVNRNQTENRPEISGKLELPFFQSIDEHRLVIPSSHPQAWYSALQPELLLTTEAMQHPQYQSGALPLRNPGSAKQQQPPQIGKLG